MGEAVGAAIDWGSNLIAPIAEAAPALGEAAPALGEAGASIFPSAAEAARTGLATGLEAGGAGIAGAGEGLFGGATGLEGTALGSGIGLEQLTSTPGLSFAGTAFDEFGSGGAGLLGGVGGGFGAVENAAAAEAARTGLATGPLNGFGTASGITPGIGAPGGGPGTLGAGPNFTPSGAGGTSVFDTATQATSIPGVNAGAAPGATANLTPGGASASSTAAPSWLSSAVDPTAAAGAAATGAAPAAAAPSSGIASLLDKAGSGALKSLTSNPLGIALGAGGLGYNILQGQKQSANQKALTADANAATANSQQMVASGEALQSYLQNGTLPPAYQQQVDQAIADAKTTAISNAAGQGLPTDPTKNTALAAELAKIDASKAGMQTQVASQLFASGSTLVGSGLSAAGLSGQLFSTLVQQDTAGAANTGKAIATLAAAMNGKSSNTVGGTNITVSPG